MAAPIPAERINIDIPKTERGSKRIFGFGRRLDRAFSAAFLCRRLSLGFGVPLGFAVPLFGCLAALTAEDFAASGLARLGLGVSEGVSFLPGGESGVPMAEAHSGSADALANQSPSSLVVIPKTLASTPPESVHAAYPGCLPFRAELEVPGCTGQYFRRGELQKPRV